MSLGDMETYRQVPISNKSPYSMVYSSEGFSLGKLKKNREATFVQTLIFDKKTDCYINFAKSAEFEEKKKNKDRIYVEMMYSFMFQSTGPKSCRLIYILYADFKMALDGDLFYKRFIKERAKDLTARFNKCLNERTKMGTASFERIDDIFSLMPCLDENLKRYPLRSWFGEYESLYDNSSGGERKKEDRLDFLDFLDVY